MYVLYFDNWSRGALFTHTHRGGKPLKSKVRSERDMPRRPAEEEMLMTSILCCVGFKRGSESLADNGSAVLLPTPNVPCLAAAPGHDLQQLLYCPGLGWLIYED